MLGISTGHKGEARAAGFEKLTVENVVKANISSKARNYTAE